MARSAPIPSLAVDAARRPKAAAPFTDIDALETEGAIAVLASHPDDETLGYGGSTALATDADRHVVAPSLLDGEASHRNAKTYTARVSEATTWLDDRLKAYGAARASVVWEADPHLNQRAAQAATVAAADSAQVAL